MKNIKSKNEWMDGFPIILLQCINSVTSRSTEDKALDH